MTERLAWGRRTSCARRPLRRQPTRSTRGWTRPSPVDRERAQRQWDALVATLPRRRRARSRCSSRSRGLPDLVFTANLGLVDGDTFVAARMRHAERRPEPAHAERWFRAHGFAIGAA